ncbi:MAG TPA: TonB-dependent receptor [Candidatus Methylomirabilis sp.]|nr:TonB-dependent receptor [Candidatus Methylomirabilis sp.]
MCESPQLIRTRRAALAGLASLPILLFACPAVWPQAAQATEPSQTQPAPLAQQPAKSLPSQDLTQESIENLMDVEVTSVSKTEQKLSRVAAAVFVITQEDIRRSGATNIPDLLRMVPGMDVAQINGSTWAIGSRGFNSQFANKLLVMVDGRSVYSPTFSGVFWDTLDLPLADIDRIEVIRGPGGSIWGANAVTGVISIFTKKAAETAGTLVEAGGGNVQQGFGMVQYGGTLGKDTDFRVYSKYFNQDHLLDLTGQNGADGWYRLREGFRADSTLSPKDSLMFEGDISTGREGEFGFELPAVTSPGFVAVPEEISLANGSLETVWNHTYSARSDSSLQFSYDQHRRDDPLNPEKRNTFDIDFRHHLAVGDRQEIVWGLGYRETSDQIGGSLTVAIIPAHRNLQLVNSFIQDEIALVQKKVYLTVGTKLEHNDFTGFEFMPSVRATWTPSDRHMLWTAVSRALRAPSQNDTDLVLNIGNIGAPGGTPVLLRLLGNPNFKDEQLISYEAGYRTVVTSRLSIDLAAYVDDWDNAQTTEPSSSFFEASPAPPHEVQTLVYENLMYGEAHGIEIAANWKLKDSWSISSGFEYADQHLHTRANSRDTLTAEFVQESTPHHSAQLRSHVDLRRGLAWDASAYFVNPLANQGPLGNVRIPAYTRLDTGLTWKPLERFSVSVVGQNLLKDHHMEFEDIDGSLQSGQIKRSAYAKLTWQF